MPLISANFFSKRIKTSIYLLVILTLAGCVTQKSGPLVNQLPAQSKPKSVVNAPQVYLGTVAVAKVNIEHPAARLVFRDNGVSDNIVRHLKGTGQFRVIDWTNLEDVLFRRNLRWSDLNDDKNVSRKISNVLLNDYFLSGTVTSYGERMNYSSSAFSKSKTQIVSTTVELTIKDALTNEIVAVGKGQGETSKVITQTLGFGAAGGNDTVLANKALEMALDKGIASITAALTSAKPNRNTNLSKTIQGKQATKPIHLPPDLKILFLFAEEEETQSGILKKNKAGTIDLSIAENAMAKEFLKTGCQVLTAGDVVGKAYSVAGGEELLLSGWVTEEEIFELENLLQARNGLASYAIQVGKTAGADIVITGTIRHQTGNSTLSQAPKAKLSSTYLTVKAIKVKDKKLIHIAEIQQDYMAIQSPNRLKAKVKVITLASRKASRELIEAVARSGK